MQKKKEFKTIPGTSEYQRKLAKAVRPVQQFILTGGGAPTDSDDYMSGLELKYWNDFPKDLIFHLFFSIGV